MFKKVMVSVISASMIMSSMVAVAAPFGKSSSSRSSSASSSSRSSSFNRAPSAPTRSAPSSASRNYGGISQGNSVGMTRSDVSNRVRNGTNVAPRNESTVAGNNPSGSYNSGSNSNRGYSNNGYNNNNNNRYNNGYNNGYNNTPSRGHSTGALVGAAAAGAIGGYMLNGILHNRDGSVHNGAGYSNGVPIQNSNAGMADNGTANTNGSNYSNGAGYNTSPAMGAAPQKSSFWWSLLGFLLVVLVIAVLWKLFFGRKKTQNTDTGVNMFNNLVNNKSPETEIRDMKDQMFTNFQKNNKPSGLSYIQNNSTPMLFEAIRENIESGSESRVVTVRSLESRLEDITQDGSNYVASVSYKGTVIEKDAGQEAVETPINELWNYTYDGRNWKLAGIESLN